MEGSGSRPTIRLEQFEGPLDLLLTLVERRELEITAVSLAAVADQYLEQVRRLDPLPADELVDFLFIAGKLLVIKSRALLPPERAAPDEEEEDPAEELARRLREYRSFKQAAAALGELEARGWRSYPRAAPPPALPPAPLAPTPPRLLLRALERLLLHAERRLPAEEVEGVPPPQPTISEQVALIERLLHERARVRFNEVIAAVRTRRELVVSFLALLEMLKRGQVDVTQTGLYGEIWIEPSGSCATGASDLSAGRQQNR